VENAGVGGSRHERRPGDRAAAGAGGRLRPLSPFCLRFVSDLVCGRRRPHTRRGWKLRGTTMRLVRPGGVEPPTLGLEVGSSRAPLLSPIQSLRREARSIKQLPDSSLASCPDTFATVCHVRYGPRRKVAQEPPRNCNGCGEYNAAYATPQPSCPGSHRAQPRLGLVKAWG